MLTVTLTKIGKGSRLRVEAKRGSEPVLLESFASDSAKARYSIANKLFISESDLLRHCTSVNGEPLTFEVQERDPNAEELRVCVRGKFDKADTGHYETSDPLSVITTALQLKDHGLNDPVVEWEDESIACFLDVDYHHIPQLDQRPSEARIAFLMASLQPQPVLWFVSRGRGVHALYLRTGESPANVLAGVAGFAYKSMDPAAQYDIISRSRLASGVVHRTQGTQDLGAVKRFLRGNVEEREIDEYLERRGFERGTAYEHTHCPVESNDTANGRPVWVGETGLTCKRCEAKGVTFGSRRPGFFPYSALCGSHELTEVARMVDNFTHWTHAEVVLDARCRLRGRHARLAYEGMLRLRHGDDDRVASVFHCGERLIRGVGRWCTSDRFESLSQIRATLASLPAVRSRDGKPVAERLDMFDQNVDLSAYGYPAIKPLRGMRISGEFLGDSSDSLSVVVPPPSLVGTMSRHLMPKYIWPDKRMKLDKAWATIEEVFPGINREYVQLLIVARGLAESEKGMPPFILCTGVSGSGKSSTPQIAASILGDVCTDMQWTADPARFRQAFQRGAQDGSLVVVNELIKTAKTAKVANRAAFDSFLTLTPNSLSHELHVGPVPLGRVPATVVSDTHVPSDVRSDMQIGRRFVYVGLSERLFWEEPMHRAGLGSPYDFRGSSPERADACNAIASDIIDRFFTLELRPFAYMAEDLGFKTLEKSDIMVDDPDALPDLFKALCEAPDATETWCRGKGWKKICQEDETPLAEAWRSVCDGGPSLDGFKNARKVRETDWSLVVNVPKRTEPDIICRGRAIAVRLRYGSANGGNYYVNEELLTCEGDRR